VSAGEPATPELHTRWRISPIWAIPIVALGIALWLAYTTLNSRGPEITITFRTGEGLEAGKTKVKHNDVELGTVNKVELSPDLTQVIAIASMSKAAAAHLQSGTRFWVVRPRLSLSNFSGLETLVSGSYIEMDPGPGDPAFSFVGLEEPPVITSDVPGREFILTSDRLGSIGPGTTIYFRSVKVGQVLGYDIEPNGGAIRIHAFVNAPYDKLVYDGSRFWNDSGVAVRSTPQGFKLQLESLAAVLTGAIGFDTPDAIRTGAPAKAGQVFALYEDHEAVLESSFEQRVPMIVEFESSVHGLEVGAPVEFRGIKVGNVTDIELDYDRVTRQAHIPVSIDFELQRVVRAGPLPPGVSQSALVTAAMSDLVAHGLRAQLRTSSLLTGQQVVAFDFFPDAPPAKIGKIGDKLVLPSVPADIESLEASAGELLTHLTQLLERVNKMPIEDVLQQARDVMQAYKSLAEAPEIRSSLKTLDRTLGDADTSLTALDGLLASAQSGYGNDSQVRREISDLLRQLQDTAKSVKVLADYVDQHPEAFIRGKGGP
jgi:paraquat-inducible protein B